MEVKSSELRIGNSLTDKYGQEYTVRLIDKSYILIENNQDEIITMDDMELVSGIPLTEEWMLSLGFESGSRDRFNWYFTKTTEGKNMVAINLSPMSTPHFGWQYYAGSLPQDMCQHIRVEYVHQLQNLYYVLTGEELSIK